MHPTAARTPVHFPALAAFAATLRGRSDWRGGICKRCLSAIKYGIRAAGIPRLHAQYIDFIARHPAMHAYRRRDPRLLERHQHPYVNARWKRCQRIQALLSHYRFVLTRLAPELFDAIYVRSDAPLGNLALKDGSRVNLRLLPPILFGCEGELCIQLDQAPSQPLYRIVLTVTDGGAAVVIGCLQGPHGDLGKDAVRTLTRQMHGLRPKQLMLALAQAFAGHLGIDRVLAVANAAHPLRRRRRRIEADYDGFWREQDGCPRPDGLYLLPTTPARKAEAEVPSQHRSAFRRREKLRDEAERLLKDALGPVPPRLMSPLGPVG